MIKPAPPRTTQERQAAFQARNPGYDRRRKARKRLAIESRSLQTVQLSARPVAETEGVASGNEVVADADGQLLLFPAMRPAA